MRFLITLLLLALLAVPLSCAIPLEALRSLVSVSASHNASSPHCVTVRVEADRLLASSSCPSAALDALQYVRDMSLVDDTATVSVAIALSMQSTQATSTLLWKDDAIQVRALSDHQPREQLGLPRNVRFPSVLTDDATVSIVEVDPVTMRASVVDHVTYVDHALCLGDDRVTKPMDVVCVLPRNVDDRGSPVLPSASRFLIQHDVSTGHHVLLGVTIPISNTQETDGFRLFTWLPSRLTSPEFASLWGLLPLEADRIMGPPVAAIAPSNEFIAGVRATQNGPSFCTGSLILPRYVLTAAHCAYLGPPLAYVAVGALEKEGVAGERIQIQRKHIHPKYKASVPVSPSTYDIMILELAHASSRTPIQLSRHGGDLVGQRATVMGYGATEIKDEIATASTKLRAVEVPIGPSIDACAAKFKLPLDASMLCAGGEAGKDACVGDSGGPLVLEPGTKNQKLLAVVSFGRGCGAAGYAGAYTRVDKTRSFINDVTKIDFTGKGFVWNAMGK